MALPTLFLPMTRSRADDGNPFLDDVFAPVADEVTHENLAVRGQLPPELDGLYVRIGPNPVTPPHPGRYHWFVGDGMVHGVRLSQGKALWYRNRWIGSNTVQRALGRPRLPGPRRGVSDVVNTNVFGHAGRLWASVEAGMLPVELDAQLASVRHGLFDSPPSSGFSAHPHRDPLTGDLHAICYDGKVHHKVQYVRVSATGQVDRVVDIPVKHGPMIHDCAITGRHVVVMDLPVTFSWRRLFTRRFPYAWNDRHAARVGLLPRDGQASDIRWLSVDPCFVFHPCNAYDLPDGGVVMDVVVHSRMFDRSTIGPEMDATARFERWTLPAGGQQVLREVISEIPQEFPRLDERLTGQPYRYAYAVSFNHGATHGRLLRHDLHTRQTVSHDFGLHGVPGEFVFVPRSPDSGELEGWMVGYVHNRHSGLTELHVIDAAHVEGAAQAIVPLPVRVPMGFHGNWVPAQG